MRSVPIPVPMTKEELSSLKKLQVQFRWDWPATFSANWHGDIWPFITYSYTREDQRIQLRGKDDLLGYIADLYISVRPEGGRFFIDDEGAYYGKESSNQVQFAKFSFVTPCEASRRPAAKPLGQGRTEEQRERHNDGVCFEDRCQFCADEWRRNWERGSSSR